MDNAKMHKEEEIFNYFLKIGVPFVLNTPYTPQLNIVEYAFQYFKKKIKN